MAIINLTLEDEIGRAPTLYYLIECNDIGEKVERVVSRMNGQKWRYNVDIEGIKKVIREMRDCSLLQKRIIVEERFTGGPIGMREYIFPSMYEEPAGDLGIEPEMRIKCTQEGFHMQCSLKPLIP